MNPEQKVVRRRRTRAEIQQLVTEFLSSGMKESEFCRTRGLSWDTLNRNLKKQGRKRNSQPGSRLVRVKLAGTKHIGQNSSSALVAVVRSGRRIEVGPGFDAQTLGQLVQVLERT